MIRQSLSTVTLLGHRFPGSGDLRRVSSAEGPMRVDVFTGGAEGYHTFRIPSINRHVPGDTPGLRRGPQDQPLRPWRRGPRSKRSTDGGQTWGPLQLVYDKGGDTKITIGNPCPVLDRDTGTVWLPFTRDNTEVFVTHSSDDGQTWAKPVNITAAVKKGDWTWYATGPGVGVQMRRGATRAGWSSPAITRSRRTAAS